MPMVQFFTVAVRALEFLVGVKVAVATPESTRSAHQSRAMPVPVVVAVILMVVVVRVHSRLVGAGVGVAERQSQQRASIESFRQDQSPANGPDEWGQRKHCLCARCTDLMCRAHPQHRRERPYPSAPTSSAETTTEGPASARAAGVSSMAATVVTAPAPKPLAAITCPGVCCRAGTREPPRSMSAAGFAVVLRRAGTSRAGATVAAETSPQVQQPGE